MTVTTPAIFFNFCQIVTFFVSTFGCQPFLKKALICSQFIFVFVHLGTPDIFGRQ